MQPAAMWLLRASGGGLEHDRSPWRCSPELNHRFRAGASFQQQARLLRAPGRRRSHRTDGNTNDLTISEIKGRFTINGDMFGEVHVENVTGPVSVHTSSTDVQIASPSRRPHLRLRQSSRQRIQGPGPRRHSFQRHRPEPDLRRQLRREPRRHALPSTPAGAFSVEAKNNKGDVELTLPPNASANVNGRTHNGDIITEYGLNISGEEDKSVTGKLPPARPKSTSAQATAICASRRARRFRPRPALPTRPLRQSACASQCQSI